MPNAEQSSVPPGVAEVTVAVRDPIVHEIVLALIRLNKMQGRSISPQEETSQTGSGPSILVGYISSLADVEYFDLAMRQAGHPPFVALVPHDVNPQLLEAIEKKVTKIIRLPEDARTIADAIRGQWAPPPASRGDRRDQFQTSGEPA
jgi:hypothetical protein